MTIPRTRTGLVGPVLVSIGLILAGIAIAILLSDNTNSSAVASTDYSAIPAKVSYAAPTLQLRDLAGEQHSLDEYAGKVVLVNLWATWCPPCAAEMPNLQSFHKRHADEGFTVIAIDDGDPEPQVLQFVSSHKLSFPIWLDPTYEATDRAFRTADLPSSYLIDRDGIVRLVWFGAISEGNLEKYVAPLIKE